MGHDLPVQNPIVSRLPHVGVRDPALYRNQDLFHLFYTAVELLPDGLTRWTIQTQTSQNLRMWSAPRSITGHGYASPGNVIVHDGMFVLCAQTYPIPPGMRFGSSDCRLVLLNSNDLVTWSEPRVMMPMGCTSAWAESPRQIDPFLVQYEGRWYCLYKAAGQLGLLVSDDLAYWQDASPDQPIVSRDQIPSPRHAAENPCVVHDGRTFVVFFPPCGNGIIRAHSDNLRAWRDFQVVELPRPAWCRDGQNAPMIIDCRADLGVWLMAFHHDHEDAPRDWISEIGLAWSTDLETWQLT